MNRFFIVGTPRSGTTLIQRIFASDPKIITFPETHFMYHLIGNARVKRGLGLANAEQARKSLIDLINCTEIQELIPKVEMFRGIRISQWVHLFQHILDEWAKVKGATCWVEKTPLHLHYLPELKKNISNSSFVHILRDGVQVVASLMAVSKSYPEQWGGAWSIDKAIDRWLLDCKLHLRYYGLPGHVFILYEQLISAQSETVKILNQRLNLGLSLDVINTVNVFNHSEPWKNDVNKPISKDIASQKQRDLTDNELTYIRKRIEEVNLMDFRSL